jgi:uncharacterized protein YcnI
MNVDERSRMRVAGVALVAAVTLLAPAAAGAHVTLQPSEVPAGGFARLNVRVPNEQDNAATTRVEVRFPPGFASASYEPVPGWDIRVEKERLREPIEQHGEPVNEQVARVVISGGSIAPGQFQDFGLSVGLPDEPGRTLVFRALQTYDSGEVVRWIGPEDADKPAARVTLTEPEAEHGATDDADEVDAEAAAAETDDEDDDDGNGLAVVALIVGALALLLAVAGMLMTRRRGA